MTHAIRAMCQKYLIIHLAWHKQKHVIFGGVNGFRGKLCVNCVPLQEKSHILTPNVLFMNVLPILGYITLSHIQCDTD